MLAVPLFLFGTGAASNQLVLIANHDKFPVLMNDKDTASKSRPYGMIDDTHCVMTGQTHLNFLADIFDTKEYMISVGDMLIELGYFLWAFAPAFWAGLMFRDFSSFLREPQVQIMDNTI